MFQLWISALILIGLISPSSQAKSLHIQTNLWVPWGVVSSEIDGAWTHLSSDIRDLDMSFDETKVQIPLMQLKLMPSKSHSEISASALGLVWKTHQLRIDIIVPKLNIQQVITRDLGGSTARIHVELTCSSIHLSETYEEAAIDIRWRAQSRGYSPVLGDIQLAGGNWDVGGFHCDGPAESTPMVEESLRAWLADSERIRLLAQEQLQTSLNRQWSAIWEKWSHPQSVVQGSTTIQLMGVHDINGFGMGIEALLIQSDGKENEEGVEVYALDPMDTTALTNAPRDASAESPLIVISKQGMQAWLTAKMALNADWKKDLSQVSEFQRLLRSRLLQFLVWRDLRNFEKDAKFLIQGKKMSDIKVEMNTNLKVSAKVEAILMGERDQELQSYVNLVSSVTINLQPKIENGKLVLQGQGELEKLTWSYDPNYQKKYEPKSDISQTLIKKVQSSMLSDLSTTIDLPSIELGSQSWQWSGLENLGSAIALRLAPQK